MLDSGLAPRTVRYAHAILHSALHQAVKWRLLSQNPADQVELPRQQRKEIQVLDPDQAVRFADTCEADRYCALFKLALTTGMRPSEYKALKWQDILWEKGTVSVCRTLETPRGGGWRFADTKRPKSRRSIKLQSDVIQALRIHQQLQNEERRQAGDGWSDHDLIFTAHTGKPVNERNLIQRHFKPILKVANLPDIRLYDLRHTAATLALIAGVPPKVVSEQLGHASTAFTLDVYSHVLPHMQDQAAIQVENLLNETRARQKNRTSVN